MKVILLPFPRIRIDHCHAELGGWFIVAEGIAVAAA
jgi:hypothetical protein